MADILQCEQCGGLLPVELLNTSRPAQCTACGNRFRVAVFPALVQPPDHGDFGRTLVDTSEAGCFYHENKRAEVVCDGCGRFLCALCDISVGEGHYCPTCLEQRVYGREASPGPDFQRHYLRHDQLVLGVAVFSFLVCGFMAPIAFVMGIMYWRKCETPLGKRRAGLILGMGLSLLQMAFWGMFIASLVWTNT